MAQSKASIALRLGARELAQVLSRCAKYFIIDCGRHRWALLVFEALQSRDQLGRRLDGRVLGFWR